MVMFMKKKKKKPTSSLYVLLSFSYVDSPSFKPKMAPDFPLRRPFTDKKFLSTILSKRLVPIIN